jgi:hypothetical protein
MSIQHGSEIYASHEMIVTHIILALHSSSGPQIRRDGDVGCTGHVATHNQAASSKQGEMRERRLTDIQISPVVPHGIGQISPHRINKDFVLVELEDDVWQPPVALPLQALAIAGRPSPGGGRRRLERPLDHLGNLHSGCKG